MSLYVCGDTHRHIDIDKLVNFDTEGMTKKDYILVCGDCGVVWNPLVDLSIQNWYSKQPYTLLFVDGNHENHHALMQFPVTIWNGGKIHKINDSIYHLMRGQVFTIDGHTLFTMGGASSHDKEIREEGLSWWPGELPSCAEYDEALTNLEAVQGKVEYVFSHCAPDTVQSLISRRYGSDSLTKFLDEVSARLDDSTFKHWYFGHYHRDIHVNEKFTCLYDQIVRLW